MTAEEKSIENELKGLEFEVLKTVAQTPKVIQIPHPEIGYFEFAVKGNEITNNLMDKGFSRYDIRNVVKELSKKGILYCHNHETISFQDGNKSLFFIAATKEGKDYLRRHDIEYEL